MKFIPQSVVELFSVNRCAVCGKKQLGSVIIINTGTVQHFRAHQTDMFTFHQSPPCILQSLCKFPKHPAAVLLHLIHTCIYTCHKNIRWAACLINSHKPFYFLQIYPVTAYMKYCCLCQRRKCFMETLYHQIRSQLCSRCGKIFRKMKMCAMSLIHDQRNSEFMCCMCNILHIRNNTVISR